MSIGAERSTIGRSAALVQHGAAAGARFRPERAGAAGDDLQAYLWFDQKYFLPDNILTKVDHTSMAHAVEVRPPFLDHRIVEFANSLPASMKIQGSRQKVILRNLMRGKLAPAILNRKKIGFDIPTHDWFRGPLRPLLEEAAGLRVRRTSAILSAPKNRS